MLIEKWELIGKNNILDTDCRKTADGRWIAGLNMMDYEGSHVCKIYKDASLVSTARLKCMATHSLLFVTELFPHCSYIVFTYFCLQAISLQNYLQLFYFKPIC